MGRRGELKRLIYKITIPIPPKLNEQINLARSHWSKSAAAKKYWTNKLALLFKDAPQFEGKVWQQFTWYCSFANDSDNVAAAVKYINDGLVKSRVIKKDNLTIIQSPVVHYYIKKQPKTDDKVEVTISGDRPEGFW